jgi:hypothetical protein
MGMGLFWIARNTRANLLDHMASAMMHGTEPRPPKSEPEGERWKPAENLRWTWYERETWVDGEWVRSGITTPVNKITSRPYQGKAGYLDESLVPTDVRKSSQRDNKRREPDATRRDHGGRPPSRWLRSLNADELKIWLATIEVPEVGVDGMTFWTHLTRDHSFSEKRIRGLTIPEQAKLHSAAHFGY